MSPELIAIISVGVGLFAALGGLIVTAALWLGGWLRGVDLRLARLEELIVGAGLFRLPTETPEAAGVPWLKASERSFEFWENEEDAVYDSL